MATTITDLRTLVSHADSTTGWSSPVGGEGITLFTADPNPVEATGSLGMAVSIETSDILFTITAANMARDPGTLVYVWVLANGTMDSQVNGGIALIVGDGTNTIGYHVAGSDKAAFRHSDGPVGWQCLLLDTATLASSNTAYRGAETSLNFSAITEIGAAFKTLSKALGGASNCFVDTIRYGNQGIEITAGTSVVPSNFTDIAAADRSTVTETAYGICRELGSGLFGLQGPLVFGDNEDVTATWFEDTNKTIIFEDAGVSTNKYSITVRQPGATGTTVFKLGLISGTDLGSDGVDFVCPAGVGARFDASNNNITTTALYGSSFSNFDQGMLFCADPTNGPTHNVFSTTFSGCSMIEPGQVNFRNNVINGYTGSQGAILLNANGSSSWSDLSFTSSGSGHAIYIDTPGTYSFTRFSFAGYGASTTTDAVVYNNSAGAVTINVTDSDTVTFLNGTSASTTVNQNVNITLTNMKDNSEVRVYSAGTTTEIAGIEVATAGTANERTFTFSASAGALVDIRVFNVQWISDDLLNFTIPASSSEIPIAQRFDRVYANP